MQTHVNVPLQGIRHQPNRTTGIIAYSNRHWLYMLTVTWRHNDSIIIDYISPFTVTAPQSPATSYASVTPLLARQLSYLQELAIGAKYKSSNQPVVLKQGAHIHTSTGHSVEVSLAKLQQGMHGWSTPPPPEHGLDVITSWIAVLPKKTTGKFRVIVDLSSSLGHSVKDAIHCEFKLVGYSSIDDVALLMHSLCRAAPWPRLTSRTRIQNGDTPLVGSQWYSSGWLHYFQFAKLVNLPPIPVTAEKATLFVAFMGISGISCVNNRV
jgi:hypothetical protein